RRVGTFPTGSSTTMARQRRKISVRGTSGSGCLDVRCDTLAEKKKQQQLELERTKARRYQAGWPDGGVPLWLPAMRRVRMPPMYVSRFSPPGWAYWPSAGASTSSRLRW
ncbi:hypothetical protein ABLN73_10510, partial [Mycobacterium tuberculosis]